MKSILSLALAAGCGAIYAIRRRGSASPSKTPGTVARQNADSVVRYTIMFMLPVWLIAGLRDYLWHRRTRIETTSGTAESWTHLLMMAETGPAVLAALFFEINAGMIAVLIASYLAHETTAVWDISYTAKLRPIPPGEQHTHTYMQAIPFCLMSFAIATHWEQFLALIGRGSEHARLAPRLRKPPFPVRYVVAMFTALGLFAGLPHVEELLRCMRAEKAGLAGRDAPECARELFDREYALR